MPLINFRNFEFSPGHAELVVLDRGGKVTWGLNIKCLASAEHDQKPPQFTLYGLPIPQGGLKMLFGKQHSLPRGESDARDQPEALIYVWDWSAANDNVILIKEHDSNRVSVCWTGNCEDPDFYDARGEQDKFEINCICDVRYET